jgi:hypothetical protein
MPDLRRRFYALSIGLVLCGALLFGLMAHQLEAEVLDPTPAVPLFDWLSMSGILALCGVAVQWGATRERMKDIRTLEQRFDVRLGRIEDQIDSLFGLLGAERRAPGRQHYGERADPNPDGA